MGLLGGRRCQCLEKQYGPRSVCPPWMGVGVRAYLEEALGKVLGELLIEQGE